MFTFLRSLWRASEENRKELLMKLEKEENILDHEIAVETEQTKNIKYLPMTNNKKAMMSAANDNDSEMQKSCYTRKGVLTSLSSSNGIIDNYILFSITEAENFFEQLEIGYTVEYLCYKKLDDDFIKVVKILNYNEGNWGANDLEEKIETDIAELKKELPKYFNTQQRNILGLITDRQQDSFIVDTDYRSLCVKLDEIEIDFVPKTGDRLYLICNVQLDEDYVDKQGEILQVIKVHPARLQKQTRCTVSKVFDDLAVIIIDDGNSEENVYVTFDALATAVKLNVGDIVSADLIECERGDFIWRGIKVDIIKKNFSNLNDYRNSNAANNAIDVSRDENCVLVSLGQTKQVEMTITNNTPRNLHCYGIEFVSKRPDKQLELIEPEEDKSFVLKGNEVRKLIFEVESRFYGESKETFLIKFEKFRVKRGILIIVCEDEKEAAEAKKRACGQIEPLTNGRRNVQRSRYYANSVWGKKMEVVPGVKFAAKRRFVAHRIPHYEVPDRLRETYLTVNNIHEMHDCVAAIYPCIKEYLTMDNYARRFQTLLFLEEIEYFINFRNYDRERAHFIRDGEYLSLQIENLAERRPSLVVGDIVRAINPWASENTDKRCYEGVIHKVLFNRVLLKFNSGFQGQYNGEDYRMEFYFSRFSFRKQHYAVSRIIKHLGEQFLFPSKINLREHPQLDLRLDDEHNMRLYDSTCPWYNQNLNSVQKRAVMNILRGDCDNMPYVIFGPPGTGKTMTLVEVILQMVKQLPNSRLLVGAPSNSSADLITQRLVDSGVLQHGEFIRLVSQNQIEKDMIPVSLMPYCATIDIGTDGTCANSMIVTDSGLKLRCQMKFLGRHRVTISTCTTLGNFMQMGFPNDHFTHVLIDESGQCTESEIMIPISQVSKTRGQIVIAGDPHQLQAIIVNRLASNCGFSTSFLERLIDRSPYAKDCLRYPNSSGYDPRLLTKLLYNYRALPSILRIYNQLFYDMELISMIHPKDSREAKMLRNVEQSIREGYERKLKERGDNEHGTFFFGIRSENLQEDDSPSWFNPGEAKHAFLMTLKLYRLGIEPKDIGIITPYMKQVKHLRYIFLNSDITMPKIGSVEEFQGQERDCIIVTTVRSSTSNITYDAKHSIGFVQSHKRMNVAISRARYFNIVIGNPHVLSTDYCWREYIKFCHDNDAYLGCDLPESFNETISTKPNYSSTKEIE